MDIFFKDEVITVDGREVPRCWTEFVNDGQTQEGDYINERTEIRQEWKGLVKPPEIGEDVDGEVVFHLMATSVQANLLDQCGVLLARSYAEFQMIHPTLAKRCIEVEYIDGESIGRCKVADLPDGAKVLRVIAPSKYLGLESPMEPEEPEPGLFPTQLVEASTVDLEFIRLKEEVKPFALPYIKSHPACTTATLLTAIKSGLSSDHAAAAQVMLTKYATNAFEKGIIKVNNFEALRDLIVIAPVETLMEYLK